MRPCDATYNVDLFSTPERDEQRNDVLADCFFTPAAIAKRGKGTRARTNIMGRDTVGIHKLSISYNCRRCNSHEHAVRLPMLLAIKIALGGMSFKAWAAYKRGDLQLSYLRHYTKCSQHVHMLLETVASNSLRNTCR
jgi:hypothetical protein